MIYSIEYYRIPINASRYLEGEEEEEPWMWFSRMT